MLRHGMSLVKIINDSTDNRPATSMNKMMSGIAEITSSFHNRNETRNTEIRPASSFERLQQKFMKQSGEIEIAKSQLKNKMGINSVIKLGGESRYVFKNEKRNVHTVY